MRVFRIPGASLPLACVVPIWSHFVGAVSGAWLGPASGLFDCCSHANQERRDVRLVACPPPSAAAPATRISRRRATSADERSVDGRAGGADETSRICGFARGGEDVTRLVRANIRACYALNPRYLPEFASVLHNLPRRTSVFG